MSDLVLTCHECGALLTLGGKEQAAILAELTRPAQREIVECRCGAFQFVLEAKKVRPRERKASANAAAEREN